MCSSDLMYYLQYGVGSKALAIMFAVFALGVACFGIGTFPQVNAILDASEISLGVDRELSAFVLTLLVAFVTLGGIKSIANVAGKVVVITGGGTGIGLASAIRLGEAGAKVVISGRTLETLEDAKSQVEAAGGECHLYICDVSDMDSCDQFVAQVTADHGQVDILINNAGRSIRRAVEHSYDRFHDFERTMQLNYFGCLRLSLGVLPQMSERRSGHIINISSMGVVGPPARFSAYIASKSALEGWSRCAEAEF